MKSKIFFIKTVVILTIMLILFGCEKNKPEDQNDNQKEITQNSIRITQEAEQIVDLAITNSLASSDSIFPDLIVAEIEKIDGVKYTELSPNGTNIKVQQDDGSCINVMIISRDDQRVFELIGNKKASVDIKQRISKNLLRETPKGNKAIILAPFQSDFKEDLDLIENTLQSAGFEVVSFLNEKATLEKFHGSFLSDYDIIYITSHGNGHAWTIGNDAYSNIVTGDVISEDQDLIFKNNGWDEFIAKSKGRYAVTAKWLEMTGASFDGSYLFLNSCGSTHYRQNFNPELGFPQPLIELGAGGISGWDNTIEITIGNITAEKLFSYLCDKYSLSGASNMVRSDPEIYDLSFSLKIWNIHPSQWEKIETIDVQLLTNHQRLSDESFYIYYESPSQPTNPIPHDGANNVSINTSLSWECNDPENDPITYDVYFGTTTNPQIVQSGLTENSFTPNLDYYTTYYWKVNAKDNQGNITEGVIWSFTTESEQIVIEYGTLTDNRDGRVYKTVKIGQQWWMAENLAYLPEVSSSSSESYTDPYYYINGYQGSNVNEAKATNNYKTYGVLYNWPAALITCPEGWHLPSDAEWKELEIYLGMSQSEADTLDWRGTNEGSKLKSTTGWNSNGNGTNENGFNALPGGLRDNSGLFGRIGERGYWWSASERLNSFAWFRCLSNENAKIYRYNGGPREDGFSVRCLRD